MSVFALSTLRSGFGQLILRSAHKCRSFVLENSNPHLLGSEHNQNEHRCALSVHSNGLLIHVRILVDSKSPFSKRVAYEMEKNIKPAATQDFKTPTLRFIRPKQRRKLEKEDTGLLLTGTKNPIKKHEVAHVHLQGSLGGISGRRPIKVCLNVHSALILELPTADRKVHIMNLLAKEDQMFIGTKRLELKAQEKLGDEKCFSLPVVKGTGWDVIKSNVQTFFTFEGSIPHRQIRYEDKILKAHFSANESAGWLEKVVTSDQGRQAITLRAFEAGECIYCDRPEAIESSGCRGCGDDTRHQLAMKCLLEKRVNGKKRLLPGKLSSGEVDIVKSPVGKITNVTISAFVLDFIATNDDSIFFILAPEDLVEAFAHYVEDLQGADNYKLRLNAMEKVSEIILTSVTSGC